MLLFLWHSAAATSVSHTFIHSFLWRAGIRHLGSGKGKGRRIVDMEGHLMYFSLSSALCFCGDGRLEEACRGGGGDAVFVCRIHGSAQRTGLREEELVQ